MPNDITLPIPLIFRVSALLQNNQRVIQYNLAVFLECGDMDSVVFAVHGSKKALIEVGVNRESNKGSVT